MSAQDTVQPLLVEIQRRSLEMYRRLQDGHDAPPSLRLRLEGLLEGASLLGVETQALQLLIDGQHQAVYGCSLQERIGADWPEQYPFPAVPALMHRAPVVPSTRD